MAPKIPVFHRKEYDMTHHLTRPELQDFRKKPVSLPPYPHHTRVIERVMGEVAVSVESERLPRMPSEVQRSAGVTRRELEA